MNGSDFWKAFSVPLGLLILFVLAFWAVYGLNKTFTKIPTIELISGDDIVTDQAEVPITGVVKDTSKLSVNGKDVSVGADGAFNSVVPVQPGVNNVEVSAGGNGQAKKNVKITREEVARSITATSIGTNSTDLATSGPVENVVGSVGLAAILLSTYIYRRSVHANALQNAKNQL